MHRSMCRKEDGQMNRQIQGEKALEKIFILKLIFISVTVTEVSSEVGIKAGDFG